MLVENFVTTDWLRTVEVFPVLLESPAYCAVMDRVPAVANDVVKAPWLLASATVPRVVAPFLNTIEPLAGPPNWLVTVALKVIG